MPKRSHLVVFLAAALLAAAAPPAQVHSAPAAEAAQDEDFSRVDGLYALFYTSAGSFACRLFEDKTYNNIRNFLDLALGYRRWIDPRTGEERREPYYDGTLVYHVSRNAMLVGGDPLANGLGSPGYCVSDEIRADLTFDLPGRLAMANRGGQPDTNSGTWFVTASPLPDINGRYTIIGEVVEGLDVVRDITRVAASPSGEPLDPITVERVDIVRVLDPNHVVTFERSTTRPYAEVDTIPAVQRGSDLPIWLRGDGGTRGDTTLPPLPPIHGPLPDAGM